MCGTCGDTSHLLVSMFIFLSRKKNGSMWEYDQASKKEETAKNNNKDQQASR